MLDRQVERAGRERRCARLQTVADDSVRPRLPRRSVCGHVDPWHVRPLRSAYSPQSKCCLMTEELPGHQARRIHEALLDHRRRRSGRRRSDAMERRSQIRGAQPSTRHSQLAGGADGEVLGKLLRERSRTRHPSASRLCRPHPRLSTGHRGRSRASAATMSQFRLPRGRLGNQKWDMAQHKLGHGPAPPRRAPGPHGTTPRPRSAPRPAPAPPQHNAPPCTRQDGASEQQQAQPNSAAASS